MKISIHPLFFAVIIVCALFGGLPVTLICLLTALLHECGHAFCAERMGFKCTKIKLMPYGAAAVCEIEGISVSDEIKLALAGPLVNAAICVALAGLWWFFPETYAYTDTALYANLSMCIVNLLPAYPLDGGRVAGCVLTKFFGKKAALITLKVIAALCAAALIVLFFTLGYNPTFLIFALFLLCSAIEKPPRAEMIRFTYGKRLKRGIEVKYILCDKSFTFKQAFRLIDGKKYLVFQLYDNGIGDEITQDELYELATQKGFLEPVFDDDYLSRNERLNISSEILPEITEFTQSTPNDTASSTAPESEWKS